MKTLIDELKINKSVKNYCIYKTETNSISFGINGKIIGGPYSPIESSSGIGGFLKIEWKNGEVSFVNITSSTIEAPNDLLDRAKSISYKDEYAKEFVKPYTIKNPINQYSNNIEKVIKKNQNFLVNELKYIINVEDEIGIKSHDTSLSCSQMKVDLVNSKGLELSDKFTSYNIVINWNNQVYFVKDTREVFKLERYRSEILFLGKIYKAIKNPINLKKFKTKSPKIIMSPEYSWEFFNHFVYSNLEGAAVANNMSRFKKEEFIKRKKFFADWFTLKVNPLKELTPGASNFSSEGVRSKPVIFIKNGKLITPVLDLKHAKKMNMKPTTGALTSPYVTSCFEKVKSYRLKSFISKCKEAIYVPLFLGLHTQNQITGDYSLPSPYSVYIKDGKIIGSLKTIIVGNIFKDLNKKVELVKSGLYPLPGICYSTNVTIE